MARAKREEIHWLAAASPYESAEVVIARFAELETKARKETRMDDLISRLAREKKAKEAHAN